MKINDQERRHLIAVGERICARRKQLGMTQEELSMEAELPTKRISEIEVGLHDPKYSMILRLATTLKIEISDLVPDNFCLPINEEESKIEKLKGHTGDENDKMDETMRTFMHLSPERQEFIKTAIRLAELEQITEAVQRKKEV